MVKYITGSNLFGQWLCDNIVLREFSVFTLAQYESRFSSSQVEFVQFNWSYNVLQIDGQFFISGAWNGKEYQLTKILLPTECINFTVELLVVGNDYKIILIDKKLHTMWVLDMEKQDEFKKIKFSVETPLKDNVKKQKITNSITKAVMKNDSCLYLTSEGNVYSGMLPSYVDTRHCKEKICDIQCGYEHYVFLTEEGRVYTWGNGRRLQLGHGDVNNQELPTEVDALAGIKIIKISCGGWHSLALSAFGDVYAWGWNDTGQLGIKKLNKEEQENFAVPTLVDLFDENGTEIVKNVKDIACGSRHSAIILEDNTVWTSGCNKYGQLGFSDEKYVSINYFRKAFQCDCDCYLMCGPWSTVIISK